MPERWLLPYAFMSPDPRARYNGHEVEVLEDRGEAPFGMGRLLLVRARDSGRFVSFVVDSGALAPEEAR